MEHIAITNQSPWIALGTIPSTAASALPAASAIVDSATAPTEDVANGKFVIRCPGPAIALIRFAVGEIDGDTGSAAIIAHTAMKQQSGTGRQYSARYIGKVNLTAGSVSAAVSATSGIDSDDGSQLWADTITITDTDATMSVIGRDGDGEGDGAVVPDNHPVMLKVDLYGEELLEIIVTRDTCTAIRPVVRFVSSL